MQKDLSWQRPLAGKLVPFKITAIYALVGGLWVLFSDKVLAMLISDSATITRIQTYKGGFYVLATALMLHLLICRGMATVRFSEKALRDLAQGVSAVTGAAFFQSLVLHIAKVLKVNYVIIAQLSPDDYETATTVAVCGRGEIIANFSYLLAGTPCENVATKGLCTYPSNVCGQFPNDRLLQDMGVDSYMGIPLFDSSGYVFGIIAVMDVKPLHNRGFAESMLRIFAVRAAAELERKRSEERLQYLAYHDPLTDLPNRTLFYDRLALALANAHRHRQMLAVLFIDLDQFKNVNDTLGHAMGDRLLQGFAERLTGSLREGDTIARMGSDEFTMLLPEIDQVEDAVKIAQCIFGAIKESWVLSGYEFHITASIGISVYPNDGADADNLLKNADTAMHRAKEKGRNNYQLYTPAMNEKILERLALEKSMRFALMHEEFVVYYQPQVNICSGEIIGLEALVRWQHPNLGLVFPDRFISSAEETGLILPIGEWVLRTACAQNKAWQDKGYQPVRVAVNLSPYQFQQQNLVETVSRVLLETGLAPQWLELEITEGIAMQDVEMTITTLRDLRAMGIGISIDDFGSGYSSLNYLIQFPISKLKIDQSFIREIESNPKNAAIVTTIIVLAQNLKLQVIAEGVENAEQFAFLKQNRCEEMQGYLFGKPVPAEIIEEVLKAGRFSTVFN